MRSRVIAAIFAAAACVADAEPLTLERAVEEALARNPVTAGAAARSGEAAAALREARARRLPHVELSESATRGNNPVFVFGALLEQEEFSASHFDPAFLNDPPALTSHRLTITARVPIFDAMQTSAGIGEAAAGVAMTDAALESVRQHIRLATIQRYYEVTLATERLATATASAGAAENAARAARDRFEQGLIVESDAFAAEAQMASFRSQVIAAEGELAVARAALASHIGRDLDSDLEIVSPLTAAVQPQMSASVAEARAAEHRHELRIAKLSADAAMIRELATRRSALPRLDAFGNWGATGGSFDERSTDYTAGVVLSVPLFDAGRPARNAGASARVRAAEAELRRAADQVKLEARAAWYRSRAALDAVSVTEAAVKHAEAAEAIVRDRYAEGLTTITEQLQALAAVSAARLAHLSARHRAVIAHAELLRATGDLNDVESFR